MRAIIRPAIVVDDRPGSAMARFDQAEVDRMETRQRCPNCGSEVEALDYCGVCGHLLPDVDGERDESLRGRLLSLFGRVRARPLPVVLLAAAIVVFLLLLGGQAGLAVLVGLLVTPYVLLSWLTRLDLYEREPWALLGSVVGAGALLGLLGGWLSSVILERFWFNDSRLNIGAVGFAGISANGEGGVPFGVLLLNGIVVPVLIGAAVLSGPIVLRRWPVFRNEILDGMTLGGLAAAGFTTLSGIVYFWPSLFDSLPDRPVGEWTAMLAGTLVLRPLVLILSGSLLGIAAWQYTVSKDLRAVFVAGVAGVFGWLALPLGSLALTPSGAVTEFVWYLIVLVVVGFLFREALSRGLTQDRSVLSSADGENRVVCPNCHRVTPDGRFCSFCRAPLHEPAPVALSTPQTLAQAAGPAEPSGIGTPVMSRSEVAESGAETETAGMRPTAAPRSGESDPEAVTGRRSSTALTDEPEADPLDYLLAEEDDAGSSGFGWSGEQPESQPLTSPTPKANVSGDDGEHHEVVGPDDATSVNVDSTAPVVDEDAGLFPTDESTATELPIDATVPMPPQPNRPAEASTPVTSPWSNVRPFRGSPTPSPEKTPSRTAWLPGSSRGPESLRPTPLSTTDPPSDASVPGGPAVSTDRDPAGVESTGMEPSRDSTDSSPPDSSSVSSSSGRWFEASSGRSGDAGTSPTMEPIRDDQGHQAGSTVDLPGSGRDADLEAPTERDASDGSEANTDRAQPVPSGVRWSGWQPDDSDDSRAAIPTEATEEVNPTPGSTDPDEVGDTGLRPDGAEAETQESPRPRTGIWRQFACQVRPPAPRAPQRDSSNGGEDSSGNPDERGSDPGRNN